MLGGYANKIGFVNLSAGSVELKDSPEDWKLKYVGGRGMGVKYVFENGPGVDPLSPENILCFMNGPLTVSEANMSGRMAIVTKSPLTGTKTSPRPAKTIQDPQSIPKIRPCPPNSIQQDP